MNFSYCISRLFKVCLVLLFLTSEVVFAQGSGSITGKIYDKTTKDGLPGANIIVKGTSIGAATDLDGKFILRNVPAGTHTIQASYIGYVSQSLDLTIVANRTLEQDFALSVTTLTGKEVVITAQAQGQLEAINQQLASDNIVNVVAETKIQEMPDFNAAATLSRLPGISTTKSSGEDEKVIIRGLAPKYNSIEIEGVTLSATGSSNPGYTSDVFATDVTGRLENDRSVDLTMVSPYMIRMISVYKSLTPDMNANSIGGTVNMELREAPSSWHTDLLWQSGYTAKSKTYGNYRFVASGSNRFFDDKFGVYALFNMESYDRNADNLDAAYQVSSSNIDSITGYRPVQVNTVTFNRHIETRKRYGGNLILDYRLPNGSIKVVNLLARINSNYTDHNQTIDYNHGNLLWRLRIADNDIDQRLHSIKLDYDLGFMTADLSANYTFADNISKNSPLINFDQETAVLVQNRDNIIPEDLNYLVHFIGDNKVILRSGNLFSNDYQEKKYTYRANFQIPYNLGDAASGFLKFGGQYDNQSNFTNQEAPYLAFDGNATPGSNVNIANEMMKAIQSKYGITIDNTGKFTGGSFLNTDSEIYSSFLNNDFGSILYASNPALMQDIMTYIVGNPSFDASDPGNYGATGRNGGWYNGPYQKYTNDYHFDLDYYAAYGMAKINFLDFMVIGGARYEKVKSNYFAFNAEDMRNVQTQKLYDTTSVNENEFLLPMVQAKYSPFDWMDVRYAYTQTLARPDYQALSPKFTKGTGTGNIYASNPDLEPARSFNHDLSFTFHNNEIGLLTVGGFYKTVENFVYSTNYRLLAAQNAKFDSVSRYVVIRDGIKVIDPNVNKETQVFRPINNPYDAIVKGIEIDFQHSFWYLPIPFNNMVFGINYARIYSNSKYPLYLAQVIPGSRPPQDTLITSSFTGRLIDQPNHVLNAYVGYDYEGFSSRLSFQYVDNSTRSGATADVENSSQTKAYFRIDFSTRQKLPWYGIELFLDIVNVNSENNRWIQTSIGGYQGIRNYGLTANLGVRVRY